VAERVLLTGYCPRPRGGQHVMFRVIATRGGFMIDAPRYCAGREAQTWTHLRRPLDPASGRVSRYGCQCRKSALVSDGEMSDWIHGGRRRVAIAASNISLR
jgi:hypothetical protein